MLPSPPSSGDAALFDYAQGQLGVYLNAAGNAWPELRENLFQILSDHVASLAFVPSGWLDDVKQACGSRFAPQIQNPYLGNGQPNPAMPEWLRADKAYLDAWAAIADQTKSAVMLYAQGKIDEGRAEIARLSTIADFWDGLYRVTKAVADAPANAIGAVASGAQYVAGGVFKSLFSSWIVWLGLACVAAFAAWRAGLLGPIARKAAAKAGVKADA